MSDSSEKIDALYDYLGLHFFKDGSVREKSCYNCDAGLYGTYELCEKEKNIVCVEWREK